MIPGIIEGGTHRLQAPCDWPADEPSCGSLVMRRVGCRMTSAWLPTVEELQALVAGAPVYLTVYSRQHPPVAVYTGPVPQDQDESEPQPN